MATCLKNSSGASVLPSYKDICGVILAGGKNSRYGSNKAFARVNGVPLIERVIEVLRVVFKEIILITNTPNEYAYLGLPMYMDIIKNIGPLGGIHAGLSFMSHSRGFFVACDMPYLSEDLIRYMARNMGTFSAVVPRISWKIEPLHALYDKKCLASVKQLIACGTNQVVQFFDNISVRYVEEDEIRRFDPELISFFNVNTPKQLRRTKSR